MKVKKTVTTTRGHDELALVALVGPEDHRRMIRLFFALKMGTAKPLSKPRGSASAGAIRAVFTRFAPRREFRPRMRLEVIAGYAFHLGLFALLFFAGWLVMYLVLFLGHGPVS